MTNIEKTILTIIVVLSVFLFFNLRACNKKIEQNGGMHSIIVEIGKELKSIEKEIKGD